MLMTLGLFVFTLPTAPFQERRRQTNWRWPQQSRVDARPSVQFLGPGEDTIELSGVLMPEITGGPSSLEALRAMAAGGLPWPLIDVGGFVFGLFVIESIDEAGSYIMDGGQAQRIEFNLRLRRTDDYFDNAIGDAADAALALFA